MHACSNIGDGGNKEGPDKKYYSQVRPAADPVALQHCSIFPAHFACLPGPIIFSSSIGCVRGVRGCMSLSSIRTCL